MAEWHASRIEVQNHLLPVEVFAYAADMDLVVILFPSFADGRGFSLARLAQAWPVCALAGQWPLDS